MPPWMSFSKESYTIDHQTCLFVNSARAWSSYCINKSSLRWRQKPDGLASGNAYAWWYYQMETCPRYWPFVRGFHRSPVNSPQRPVTRSCDVFFDLRLKRLSNQSWGCWFETLSHLLWRQCKGLVNVRKEKYLHIYSQHWAKRVKIRWK